jgi:hypothetical protein
MPPLKLDTALTSMPVADALIAPVLEIPPVKVDVPSTRMPRSAASSAPAFLMPPRKVGPVTWMAALGRPPALVE